MEVEKPIEFRVQKIRNKKQQKKNYPLQLGVRECSHSFFIIQYLHLQLESVINKKVANESLSFLFVVSSVVTFL